MGRSKKARRCPECGSRDVLLQDSFDDGFDLYVCVECDHEFEVGGSHARSESKYDYVDSDFEDAYPESEPET